MENMQTTDNGGQDAILLRKKIISVTRIEGTREILLVLEDGTTIEFTSQSGIQVRIRTH